VPALMTRVVVSVLVARVIAAPVALRPNTDGSLPHSVLVIRRVCTWPPQRLERFSRSSKLLQLSRGKNGAVSEDACLPREPRALRTPFLGIGSSLAQGAFGGQSTGRLTDHLRC
jgi:hypothetical protein